MVREEKEKSCRTKETEKEPLQEGSREGQVGGVRVCGTENRWR